MGVSLGRPSNGFLESMQLVRFDPFGQTGPVFFAPQAHSQSIEVSHVSIDQFAPPFFQRARLDVDSRCALFQPWVVGRVGGSGDQGGGLAGKASIDARGLYPAGVVLPDALARVLWICYLGFPQAGIDRFLENFLPGATACLDLCQWSRIESIRLFQEWPMKPTRKT